MKSDFIGFIGFMFIVFIVTTIFIVGFLTGLSIVGENQSYLTGKVQDQFWQIQLLDQELATCEYHLGNEQSIVLNAVVTERMLR